MATSLATVAQAAIDFGPGAGEAYGFKMDVILRIQVEAVAENQGAWCCHCGGLSRGSACSAASC